MEQKALTNEEIARAMKVVEAVTGTKIDWMINPHYIMDKSDNMHYLTGRNIRFVVHRNDGCSIEFHTNDTGYYNSLRNNILMAYVRYLEDYEVK